MYYLVFSIIFKSKLINKNYIINWVDKYIGSNKFYGTCHLKKKKSTSWVTRVTYLLIIHPNYPLYRERNELNIWISSLKNYLIPSIPTIILPLVFNQWYYKSNCPNLVESIGF